MGIASFTKRRAPKLGGDKRDRKREAPRGNSWARGYNTEWEEIRDRYKRAAGGLCEECMRRGYQVVADVIDHMVPIEEDKSLRLDWNNLDALCHSHHNGFKRRLEAYAKKTGAIRMLQQWVKHPETRPAQFQIVKYGPLRGLSDGQANGV